MHEQAAADQTVPEPDRADRPFAAGAAGESESAQLRSDRQLARVLVELAHTLGTDFSVQTILDRLVQRVLDVVPVTASGVMLMGKGDELHFVAASDQRIRQIEVLQNELGEGP